MEGYDDAQPLYRVAPLIAPRVDRYAPRVTRGITNRLVDTGEPVIVIGHHHAVMAPRRLGSLTSAPAHDGGLVVFEGTPADLVAARSTLTGEHLAAYVGSGRPEAVAAR
jgi:hypothetical protein